MMRHNTLYIVIPVSSCIKHTIDNWINARSNSIQIRYIDTNLLIFHYMHYEYTEIVVDLARMQFS